MIFSAGMKTFLLFPLLAVLFFEAVRFAEDFADFRFVDVRFFPFRLEDLFAEPERLERFARLFPPINSILTTKVFCFNTKRILL